MAPNTRKATWIGAVLAGLLLTVGLLVMQGWPRWREDTVYQALRHSQGDAFWWPPDWRWELRTSILLEGEVRHPKSGTMELVSEAQGRVSRTAVIHGRYSFNPQRLPTSPFKVRLLTADGSTTRWLQMGSLDPGLHRINWMF